MKVYSENITDGDGLEVFYLKCEIVHWSGKSTNFGVWNIVSNYSSIPYAINYTALSVVKWVMLLVLTLSVSPEKKKDGLLRRLRRVIV